MLDAAILDIREACRLGKAGHPSQVLSIVLNSVGKPREALRALEKAVELGIPTKLQGYYQRHFALADKLQDTAAMKAIKPYVLRDLKRSTTSPDFRGYLEDLLSKIEQITAPR